MSRVLLHISFWVGFLLQDTVMEYGYIAQLVKDIGDKPHFFLSLKAALAVIAPKLIFAYFILYVIIDKVLKENDHRVWIVLQVAVVMALCVLLYRLALNYYTYPVIYRIKPRPLSDISRLLMCMMDIGFVSGTAVTLKLLRMQLAGKEREKTLVQEKLQTELKFLRHQTNPHFLFNTLNNIYALARKKSDRTAEIVMKLSKLLRFMLYESGKGVITIADEIKMLDDYLELEKIRYNERLQITFHKAVDNGAKTITPLLLLPFVENAFKHGVSENRFNSFVHIDIKLQQGQLAFFIENTTENGELQQITDNIGLGNVRRQLELMYKEYNLQVENQEGIFKVRLTINLDSHANILYNSGR